MTLHTFWLYLVLSRAVLRPTPGPNVLLRHDARRQFRFGFGASMYSAWRAACRPWQ